MVRYHAVKLTMVDKHGNPKSRTIIYGLIESEISSHDNFHGHQNFESYLLRAHKNPEKIGMSYGNILIDNSYSPSKVPLSFKAPCDIVARTLKKRGVRIYKVDDLPEKMQMCFNKGMHGYIDEHFDK